MCRCEDVKLIFFYVKMICSDVKMKMMCVHAKKRVCEDVKMICVDMKTGRCENVKV